VRDADGGFDPDVLQVSLAPILVDIREWGEVTGAFQRRHILCHGLHMLYVRREKELGALAPQLDQVLVQADLARIRTEYPVRERLLGKLRPRPLCQLRGDCRHIDVGAIDHQEFPVAHLLDLPGIICGAADRPRCILRVLLVLLRCLQVLSGKVLRSLALSSSLRLLSFLVIKHVHDLLVDLGNVKFELMRGRPEAERNQLELVLGSSAECVTVPRVLWLPHIPRVNFLDTETVFHQVLRSPQRKVCARIQLLGH